MEKKKDWKTRILEIVENYEKGVSVFDNDMAQAGIDPKYDFINTILKELDIVREEGRREGRKEMYEMHKDISKLTTK